MVLNYLLREPYQSFLNLSFKDGWGGDGREVGEIKNIEKMLFAKFPSNPPASNLSRLLGWGVAKSFWEGLNFFKKISKL